MIEKHSAKLAGWKFTSIPQRIILSYRIHANKDGVIYAFGGGSRFHPPTREEFLGADAAQWVEKPDAIEGLNIPMCFRRKVKAGETIMLQSFELALAAESIALEGASASTLAVADSGATTAIRSPAEVLAKEGPNAIEWALAPLKRAVPTELRQNLTLLREDLLDEAAKKPVASAEA